MTEDRQERLARGLSLRAEGYSFREAAAEVGIPFQTIARHAETTDAPDLAERIRARAAEITAKGLERIGREIDHTPDRNVAPWTMVSARLGGLLAHEEQGKGSDLGELLGRLQAAGSTVTVAARIEPKSPSDTSER